MARRKARELAFLALFQAERGSVPLDEAWHSVRVSASEDTDDEAERAYGEALGDDDVRFAKRLLDAFVAHRQEVDTQLEAIIEGWSFTQMAQTDLTVLRLALTEFLFEAVPREVTIEMAVRIAKRYGGEDSGRFVNGVLARLHRQLEPTG